MGLLAQILVTGATGFIGRHLVRRLVAQGQPVRVLARDPARACALFGQEVEIVAGDVRDAAAVRRACTGVGTIHHIAGLFTFGLKRRRDIWATNVEGTENVLRAAAEAGAARLVHLSSASVLMHRSCGPLREDADLPPEPPAYASYQASKWHAEQRVLEWARRGLPAVIASVSCPIGPEDEAPTPTGRMIRDFLARRFPCSCRAGVNFIDVRDACAGLQRAAEAGRPGRRYLLGHENLTLDQFFARLARETGLPAPKVHLPAALIWGCSVVGEAWGLVLPSRAGIRTCLETAHHVEKFQFFDSARAREELGWRPVHSLEESIREAVEWLRGRPQEQLVYSGSLASHA